MISVSSNSELDTSALSIPPRLSLSFEFSLSSYKAVHVDSPLRPRIGEELLASGRGREKPSVIQGGGGGSKPQAANRDVCVYLMLVSNYC
jgi:hypothetical protein